MIVVQSHKDNKGPGSITERKPSIFFKKNFRNLQDWTLKKYEVVSRDKKPVPAPEQPRKILLDCGANVASTVLLFRETYPGGRDFTIHSFEIDDRLAPYFSPYDKLHLHCPVGVAGKNGL